MINQNSLKTYIVFYLTIQENILSILSTPFGVVEITAGTSAEISSSL